MTETDLDTIQVPNYKREQYEFGISFSYTSILQDLHGAEPLWL